MNILRYFIVHKEQNYIFLNRNISKLQTKFVDEERYRRKQNTEKNMTSNWLKNYIEQ